MASFDLSRFLRYRLGHFCARFPSSIASFRSLIRPIPSSGSDVIAILVMENTPFHFGAISQDPFNIILPLFDAYEYSNIPFQRAHDRPDRIIYCQEPALPLYYSSSHSASKSQHHISVSFTSFYIAEHLIRIYISSSFISPHQFSSVLSLSGTFGHFPSGLTYQIRMSLFNFGQFFNYRLALFCARFPSSLSSFRSLICTTSPSGSEDMAVLVMESSFYVSDRYLKIRCTSSSHSLMLTTSRLYLSNAPKIAQIG